MGVTELCGLAFTGFDFSPENVRIVIENGIIKEIYQTKKETGRCILPSFFNAHTHIADTVAMDIPIDRPLAALVAPPNGLKHEILRHTNAHILESAMHATMEQMRASGTTGFADFREGGVEGVRSICRARVEGMQMVVLGRDGGESAEGASGLGMSNAHGLPSEEEAVARMRAAKRIVAIHAGEADPKDIEPAFSLEPDMIIHAVHFSDADIRRAADEDIAITVCPRSNWLLGATDSGTRPAVSKMLEAGCRVFLGTDNAMFVPPDMFAECAFLMTVARIRAEDVLRMAISGNTLAGCDAPVIAVGKPANLIVCRDSGVMRWSRHPLATVLTRLGAGAIEQVRGAGAGSHEEPFYLLKR